jgi:hypothetical protein
MNMKRILVLCLVLSALLFGAAFASPDVVSVYGARSFDVLLHAKGVVVARNDTTDSWVLTSPGGESFAFGIRSPAANADLIVQVDARPFLTAGLIPGRLPSGIYAIDTSTDRLTMRYELGSVTLPEDADISPLAALNGLIANRRDILGYHAALGHFGLALGGGNMVEWAGNMAATDKDLVFVLNPRPLIDAGVDTKNVSGWVLADVPMMDAQGRRFTESKLLRFYNLD